MVKLRTWRWWLPVLLIGILGLALRLDAAARLTIDHDEATYMNTALHYAWSIRYGEWKEIYRYTENAEHPVLSKLVYAGVLLWVSPAEKLQPKDIELVPVMQTPGALWILAARRTAAGLGALSVFFLALINPLAGLMMAIHTSAIEFSSEVVLDPLPFLTSLLVIGAYEQWRMSEFKPEAAGRWNWLWLLASAILLGMTAAGKYIYCVVGLAVGLDFIIRLGEDFWKGNRGQLRKRLMTMILWGLTSVFSFFFCNPILWKHTWQRLIGSIIFHIDYSQGWYVKASGRVWWHPLKLLFESVPQRDSADSGVFLMQPDLWIALLALLGLPLLWKRQRTYALWLLAALAFLLIWPTKWDQYILIAIPGLCLSAGLLVTELINKGLAYLRRRPDTGF